MCWKDCLSPIDLQGHLGLKWIIYIYISWLFLLFNLSPCLSLQQCLIFLITVVFVSQSILQSFPIMLFKIVLTVLSLSITFRVKKKKKKKSWVLRRLPWIYINHCCFQQCLVFCVGLAHLLLHFFWKFLLPFPLFLKKKSICSLFIVNISLYLYFVFLFWVRLSIFICLKSIYISFSYSLSFFLFIRNILRKLAPIIFKNVQTHFPSFSFDFRIQFENLLFQNNLLKYIINNP